MLKDGRLDGRLNCPRMSSPLADRRRRGRAFPLKCDWLGAVDGKDDGKISDKKMLFFFSVSSRS